jgi:hypothetical protein
MYCVLWTIHYLVPARYNLTYPPMYFVLWTGHYLVPARYNLTHPQGEGEWLIPVKTRVEFLSCSEKEL